MKRIMIAALAATAAATTLTLPAAAQQGEGALPRVFQIRTSAPSAWLGFSYHAETLERDGERSSVIVIDSVMPESPAARGRLAAGDTVVTVNGLRASNELIGSLAYSLEPGDEVRLRVRRSGSERDLTLTAAERPEGYGTAGGNREFTIFSDSVVGMMRGIMDSVRVHLDSLDLPNIILRGGDDARILFGRSFNDSTMKFDTLDVGRAFRFFNDSMHVALDSAMIRMGQGFRFETRGDSLIYFDRSGERHTLPRGGAYMFRSGDDDSTRVFRVRPTVRGFASLGMNSVAGAVLQQLSPELGEYFGVRRGLLVLEVGDDTPADEAGLRAGDVIVRARGTVIDDVDTLRQALVRRGNDDEPVELEVRRKESTVLLQLRR